MDTDTVIKRFESWHTANPNASRLTRHEVLKAILVGEAIASGSNPLPESCIPAYGDDKRTGIVDYIDENMAIEIDDGPNTKSVRKLTFLYEQWHKDVLWILILRTGHGGKASRVAKKACIPLLRIYARCNCFYWELT